MIRRRSRNVGRKRKHFEHLAIMNFITAIVALNEWEIGSRIGGRYEQVYEHRLFCFYLLNPHGHRRLFLDGIIRLKPLQRAIKNALSQTSVNQPPRPSRASRPDDVKMQRNSDQ